MDNRTRRTVLRTAKTQDVQSDISAKYFNFYQFDGINDSNNYATVDQNSFTEADNVYVDDGNELTTRPPIVYTELFKDIPDFEDGIKIEAIYQSNGVVFYFVNNMFFWRWNEKWYNTQAEYVYDQDNEQYYTKFKIAWINDMFIFFMQYTNEDGEKNTTLFGLRYDDDSDSWEYYTAREILYVPKSEYLSQANLESRNLFVDGSAVEYIFDGIDANVDVLSRVLEGKTVEIEIHDEIFTIVWEKSFSKILITDISMGLINIDLEFDFHQCSVDGGTVLLCNVKGNDRTAWLSRDYGLTWTSIELAKGYEPENEDTEKFDVCLSEDGMAIFFVFEEITRHDDAELSPHGYDCKTCYTNLYIGYVDEEVTWAKAEYCLLDNDTVFASGVHVTDIDPDGDFTEAGKINDYGDENLLSVDCVWDLFTDYSANDDGSASYELGSMITVLTDIKGLDTSRRVVMHAPDYMHCAVLFPLYFNTVAYSEKDDTLNVYTNAATTDCDTYKFTKIGFPSYYEMSDDEPTMVHAPSMVIHGPLYMTSTKNYDEIESDDVPYTDMILYNSDVGFYTHSIGVCGNAYDGATDATESEYGKIRYVPSGTSTNYELIISFNDNGGTYSFIPTIDIAVDTDEHTDDKFALGGTTATSNGISYRYDACCNLPMGHPIGWRSSLIPKATHYHIFKPVPEEEELLKAGNIINDNYANFTGALSNFINTYSDGENVYINLGTLSDIQTPENIASFRGGGPWCSRIPFMHNSVVNAADVSPMGQGKGFYVYMNDRRHAADSRSLVFVSGELMTDSLLFLHHFCDTTRVDYIDWTDEEDPDYDPDYEPDWVNSIDTRHVTQFLSELQDTSASLVYAMYFEFNSVEKDIDGVGVCKELDVEGVTDIILGKTVLSVAFVTNKCLYENDTISNFFWETDTFDFIPFSVTQDGSTFFGFSNSDEHIYTNQYASYGETFTIEVEFVNKYTIKVPDFDAAIFNSTALAFGNLMYQTSVSSEDNYEKRGYKKLYIPEDTMVTIPGMVTAMTSFSQTVLGIFTEYTAYEYTYDMDYMYYQLLPTKLTIGNRKGYDVLPSISGTALNMTTIYGFGALAYETFVESTEQQLSILSDNVDTLLREYDTAPIKLVQYNYWVVMYKENCDEVFVFDVRSSSWWLWHLPFAVDKIYREGVKLYVYKDTTVYELDFDSNSAYDLEDTPITWGYMTQRLHFNVTMYYKHINNVVITATPKSDKMRYVLEFKNYHNGFNIESDDTVEYYVEDVATCVKKVNFMKTNAFQFRISSDERDKDPTKFRISSISIKYRVTERIR